MGRIGIIRDLAERGCFLFWLTLGRLLRSARYSKADIVRDDGEVRVRKSRRVHAPLLVWLARPLGWMLDTGVTVLPHRAWVERERRLYQALYGAVVRADGAGGLALPFLPGETLAALLDDPSRSESVRTRCIELAVAALVSFHGRGYTHGDAMSENVMVNLDDGTASWFDFETVHDERRTPAWRRADDVRALLASCLLPTAPGKLAETLRRILDAYGDDAVTHLVGAGFASVWRRPLVFHLGQAALRFEVFREVGRLIRARGHHAVGSGIALRGRAPHA